ncbi:MAG: multicopper oxidase domain-containing protein [Erythrobacter sp.]
MSPMSRRGFVRAAGAATGFAAMPAWAQGHLLHAMKGGAPVRVGFDTVSGAVIDLAVGHGPRVVQGRKGHGVAVNGSVPGPLIRLREGQNVRLNVTNHLAEDTSIHWHGLLVPFHMDGVPGISFRGIAPEQTFSFEFPVRQSGT